METISVLFSPAASIYSVIVSLESISKRIKDECIITNVRYEQRKLSLQLQDKDTIKAEPTPPAFNISNELYSISLMGYGAKVKQTLTDFINRLFTRQAQALFVIDVPDIKIEQCLLKFGIQMSDFRKPVSEIPKSIEKKNQRSDIASAVTSEELIKQNGRLLIVDFDNLINTCYYATAALQSEEELKKTSDGRYINAIGPFIQRLLKIMRVYAPTHIAFAADGKREDIFRRNIYAQYKAHRDDQEKPAALREQVSLAEEIIRIMNIPIFKVASMEADDIIGSLATRFTDEQCGDVVILSNDKDLFQLLNPKIVQVIKNDKEMTDILFQDEYGFRPAQFVDYKAIIGETTDNIPGIKGIGKKAFPGLLNDFESLEEILLDHSKLEDKYKRYVKHFEAGKESGLLSKQLAMLQCEIPELNNIKMETLKLAVNKEAYKSKIKELELEL